MWTQICRNCQGTGEIDCSIKIRFPYLKPKIEKCSECGGTGEIKKYVFFKKVDSVQKPNK